MVDQELVAEVRELLREARAHLLPLPTVLTKARAAKELSISMSKLKALVRAGQIVTCTVGRVSMIPASEVRRLATPSGPPPRRAVRKRATSTGTAAEEAQRLRASLKRKQR